MALHWLAISQVPMGRFCSIFDVNTSTSNFGFDGGIPIFLALFRKKWELCKDNYSKSFFSTTHENCLKTSKFNKKWISQQIFSIFTEMCSGKSVYRPGILKYTVTLFVIWYTFNCSKSYSMFGKAKLTLVHSKDDDNLFA